MCIIAIKPVGEKLMDDKVIMNMFSNNPDGAGIMYASGGMVNIEKGFMNVDRLLDRLHSFKNPTDMTIVIHCRIGTGGGNTAANCHPFPISNKINELKKTKNRTDIGVAHNGIINIVTSRKDISDTMEYISSRLVYLYNAVPEFYKNKDLMTLINNEITSKMVFLDGMGDYYTVGGFVENNGILYSNSTYISFYQSYFSKYDWYDENGIGYFDDSVELMPLDPNIHIIVNQNTGNTEDCSGCLIDEYGNVYIDDGTDQLECFLLYDYEAYDFDFKQIKFNHKNAQYYTEIDYSESEKWGDYEKETKRF